LVDDDAVKAIRRRRSSDGPFTGGIAAESRRKMIQNESRAPLPAPKRRSRTIHAGLLIATVIFSGAIPAGADGPWRASDENTLGWQVMTPQERIEHQSRVREFTDYDACEAYRIQHDELMAERAKQRGLTLQEDKREREDKKDFCHRLKRAKTSNPDKH
jgi:hypothetical protein